MSAPPPVKRVERPRRKRAGAFHHGDLAEQLAVAAGELVDKAGHGSLSLRAVAARLGVSEPAIYRHYESRDALLAEVALRGFERFIDALLTAVPADEDPFVALERYGKAYVRFAVAHPGWFRLQFSRTWNDQLQHRPGVRARFAAAEEFRARMLVACAGALPVGEEGRAPDLYRLVWGTAHGLAGFVVERVFQLVDTDEERVAAACAAIELQIEGLRGRKAGAAGRSA